MLLVGTACRHQGDCHSIPIKWAVLAERHIWYLKDLVIKIPTSWWLGWVWDSGFTFIAQLANVSKVFSEFGLISKSICKHFRLIASITPNLHNPFPYLFFFLLQVNHPNDYKVNLIPYRTVVIKVRNHVCYRQEILLVIGTIVKI